MMLLFLGQDWDDALFWIFASVMIIAGAAGRDDAGHHPLRPGDDRLLRGAGRDLRPDGRAARGGRPGHRLHRRDQRPDPVRDHAHPDEGRPERGSSSRPRPVPAAIAAVDHRDRHRPRGHRRPTGARVAERVRVGDRASSTALFSDFVLPFEIVSVLLLAAVIGGVFLAKRETGRAVVSDTLDAYLVLSGMLFAIGTFGFLARRNAISMLMSIELMLNARQPLDRRVRRVRPGARRRSGSVIALMVMAVAAAEATVGLAIVIAIYRNKQTPLVDEYDAMRR